MNMNNDESNSIESMESIANKFVEVLPGVTVRTAIGGGLTVVGSLLAIAALIVYVAKD